MICLQFFSYKIVISPPKLLFSNKRPLQTLFFTKTEKCSQPLSIFRFFGYDNTERMRGAKNCPFQKNLCRAVGGMEVYAL